MECNEFWERFRESGMNPELASHLEECPDCNSEFIIECELDRIVDYLPDHTPPASVWDRIENALDDPVSVDIPDTTIITKPRAFFRRMLPDAIPLKHTVVGYAAVILLTAGVTFIATRSFIPGLMGPAGTESVVELEDAEKAYLEVIEKFSGQIEASKESIDPELYDLYMDKLAILDEYILQCKEAVEENEYNPNARRYLAMAYVEKTNTLKEMANLL